jgi:bacterioferritin
LIVEEEEHQDRFDTEIENLEHFGENYLALQSIEHSKKVATNTVTT